MFRHEGVFDDSVAPEIRALATPRYLERARLLGALLRVVYLLSASMPGVIPKLRWRAQADGGLSLIIPRSPCRPDGERPAGRLAQLARITGRNLALVESATDATTAAVGGRAKALRTSFAGLGVSNTVILRRSNLMRDFAAHQLQGALAEHLPPPAVQGRHVGVSPSEASRSMSSLEASTLAATPSAPRPA